MKPPEYDSIHKRGRALEEAFFAERDQQLLQALRRRLSAEEAANVLAAATGVSDQIVIRELAELPAAHFLAVLGIFPLVEVAWCDRTVSAAERKAVLAAAADMGVLLDSPAHRLLDRWLESRPAETALSLWTDYVRAVCATLKPETVATLKDGVMQRARKIALAAGGVLGLGNKISAAEQACLDRLTQAFEPVGTQPSS
jgi:hypothetical protein